MNEPHLSFGLTINKLLRSYREMAGLSQNELVGLSAELYADGLMDRFYTQPAIARYEADPYDGAATGRRTKKLLPDTIDALAVLFAHALQRAGFEGVQAAELAEFMRAANEQHYDPRRASAFALEVDATMNVFPPWLRKMAEENVLILLASMRKVCARYTLRDTDSKE